MNPVTIHDKTYELYTWDQFGELVSGLCGQMNENHERFDRVIALAKGGTAISRPVVDLLGVKELSSIQIEFYSGIGETNSTPVITQAIPVKIKDEKVLIIDDIADSGETLRLATQYVKQHGAALIKTATLIRKPWTSFLPDYAAAESEAWVIFPWEIRETILELSGMWSAKGQSEGDIREQLTRVGFKDGDITTVLSA